MCLLIKKIKDDKKSYLYDRCFVSNQNFTAEHAKIVKNSRFLFKIPGFIFKISWIPGFSRFFLSKMSNSRFPGQVPCK